jgi:thioesterase domain-containing protein
MEWNTAEDFALVLLTSGSTAEPKAVPLRVRHLLAYARVSGAHYGLGTNDRCLHIMPMFHGHGLKSCLLVPLANGSGVIVSPDFDVPMFFQLLNAMRPTWYSAAASIHQAIVARAGDYRERARSARLRFIRSGSGRLDPKVMSALEDAFGAPVLERYGMSETGNLTSNCPPPGIRKPGSVGRPVGNEVAVIDEDGRILGPNREGEVVARGPSVFDGYLDDPEATKAAFVNGWFRTGDLGRFDDDGYLVLTGRIKDVINRGGEKVGTAEVESALLQHPEVTEACAFSIPHPTLGEDVAAAVSTRRGVSEQELQTFVRGHLTGVKVPRRIFFLRSLPKSPTNKVRRSETAALCRARLETSRCGVGPGPLRVWSPLEQEIADLWKKLLAREAISPDDDFFLLGGDSLQASELFARFQRTYRVDLHVGQIFEDASTVPGMARLIERARGDRSRQGQAPRGLVPIKPTGTRPPLFVVPGSSGNPVGFIHLARLIDARQPLIGIESRGMDGIETPLTVMKDVAADNVARIRQAQPRGPYFLGGQCFGGRVAYEMARQLEAAGERVALLLMLDASSPFFDRSGRRRGERVPRRRGSRLGFLTRYVFDRMRRHITLLVTLRGAERTAFVREQTAGLRTIIGTGDLFRGDRRQFGHQAVYAANRKAGRDYVPGPYGGPAILYLTRNREIKGARNLRLDWLDLVPQLGSPVWVPGRHSGDMLNPPNVHELAVVVNEALEAAHATEERRAASTAVPA